MATFVHELSNIFSRPDMGRNQDLYWRSWFEKSKHFSHFVFKNIVIFFHVKRNLSCQIISAFFVCFVNTVNSVVCSVVYIVDVMVSWYVKKE